MAFSTGIDVKIHPPYDGELVSSVYMFHGDIAAGASELIVTPGADEFVAICGLQFLEASAANFAWKHGSTTFLTWEGPANVGRDTPLGEICFVTPVVGDALRLAIATNTLSSIVGYYFTYKEQLRLRAH